MDDEPGWDRLVLELSCIRRKVIRRWPVVILLAMLVSSATAYWRWRRPVSYQGTVVLRVTEGDFDGTSDSNQGTTLQSEIEQISLSRSALLAVMAEYELDPVMRKLDPTFAANSMRDDVSVRIVQNYFARQRDDTDPVRSARVSIHYTNPDPELAVGVARALGQQVVDQQVRSREQVAGLAVESASNVVDQLKRAMNRLRNEQTSTYMNALATDGETSREEFVKAASLRSQVKHLEGALKSAREQYAGLDLQRAFASESMAVRFEMIDPGTPERVLLTQQQHLMLTALVGFFVSLVLSALVVGVFDPRIYDAPTVKRLDLPVVGHIP